MYFHLLIESFVSFDMCKVYLRKIVYNIYNIPKFYFTNKSKTFMHVDVLTSQKYCMNDVLGLNL